MGSVECPCTKGGGCDPGLACGPRWPESGNEWNVVCRPRSAATKAGQGGGAREDTGYVWSAKAASLASMTQVRAAQQYTNTTYSIHTSILSMKCKNMWHNTTLA